MPPRSLRYLIVSVFAYAQALDLYCQEQVKTQHERLISKILKLLIKITLDMLSWSVTHI